MYVFVYKLRLNVEKEEEVVQLIGEYETTFHGINQPFRQESPVLFNASLK